MNVNSSGKQEILLPIFGSHFLDDHARTLVSDPKIALIELIANCWDAGANRVDITWPEESKPDLIDIKDDGIGMDYEEFIYRWRALNYNRKEAQGDEVIFPTGNKQSRRKAYGTNGKGRHSMFCFSNEYEVETWKDDKCNVFSITRLQGIGQTPFSIKLIKQFQKNGHGTKVSTELSRGESYIGIPVVKDLIGSKFVTDPGFNVYVNGDHVELNKIEHLIRTEKIVIEGIGDIVLHCVDSQKTGRTSRQNGVAWWVNKRLVGEQSWRDFEDIAILDARTTEAKRYTFIIEADILVDEVKDDWSDFKDTVKSKTVKLYAKEKVLEWLRDLMKDFHKSHKIAAFSIQKNEIKKLSTDSRYRVGKFVDELQSRVTVLNDRVLNATIEVLAKLEQARSGVALLEQISKLNPNDIDTLNKILEVWTVQEARIVLEELGRRLKVIDSLSKLVENPSVDELHELQPLFEKALWIFGPEYESLEFTSNKSLNSVIKNLMKDKLAKIRHPSRRPDLVALSDSSIGTYSHPSFDERGEVSNLAKVLIVELKRGGFVVGIKEMRQADDYATEIRRSGKVTRDTFIEAYVLGATISDEAMEPIRKGEPITHTRIRSEAYSTTLNRAHARTFNLYKKIEQAKQDELYDKEIEEALNSPEQPTMNLH
jgi:hypothetical protein